MSLDPQRIAILLPDLRGGGAERMHLPLAAHWKQLGFDVQFVLLRKEGELLSALPIGVTAVDLGAASIRAAFDPLVRYLRSSRPAVLLAAMWPLTVMAVLASRWARVGNRVVVSDHSMLSSSYAGYGRLHRLLLRSSLAFAYPFADARLGVSRSVATDLAQLSGIARSRFSVVYNPAAIGAINANLTRPAELAGIDAPIILSVGALKAVKNQALLIEAFSRMDTSIRATLCILGEGAQREALEALIRNIGLQGRVLLPGYKADPGPFYRSADLFVLSSDHEGFGNVIVEALECGVPVVSTDCPGGPREILADGQFGLLSPVGDPDALAAAMTAALHAAHDRDALKARAREFSLERISLQYLEFLCPGRGGIAA